MQSEQKNTEDGIESDAEAAVDDVEATVVMTETDLTDNVGDVSVEINVEELVARVEAEQDEGAKRKKEVRQRLEELAEEQGFEATYAIEFEKD